MEIISTNKLTFPILEHSKRWHYLCAGNQNDYRVANKIRLKNLNDDIVTIYDSSGRKLLINSILKGKPHWPGILDFIGCNLKYEVFFEFKIIENLDLDTFKAHVIKALYVYTKDPTLGDSEIFTYNKPLIEKAKSYKEIIELFY
ncbi:MAG: hypothetical protein LAT83_00540 [Kiritimatiellae bacterium]|nr:hypothetical protein [Kiritimatiellia bacterium]